MNNLDEELLSIGEAAKLLNVSIDTLRRWDENSKLKAVRTTGGHRVYRKQDIEIFLSNLWEIASEWVSSAHPFELPSNVYCSTSSIFQARLSKMQTVFGSDESIAPFFSLLVAIAGEVGSNSFDHNLGSWPDVAGIMFAFDIHKRQVVLADRGLGILRTLGKVKPELASHADALKVAFTEVISGRKPESRGNGLKFVRKVMQDYPIDLLFQTGDASLTLRGQNHDLKISSAEKSIAGCLALVTF